MSQTTNHGVAGFTLIEVLIALAIVSISLAAIGSLMASTIRTMRSIDQRFALVETARAIETGLPGRADLTGSLAGDLAGHRWRVDVSPFIANFVDPRLPSPWVPQTVVIRVQSPGGAILQVNTVRLQRRTGG
ncbi:MAG TPA: prepilin-type N-terminal cleavage/methylation domain-containing protein [Xanthobacteraceae bacterium]|jgi:general secretion pathway protein I